MTIERSGFLDVLILNIKCVIQFENGFVRQPGTGRSEHVFRLARPFSSANLLKFNNFDKEHTGSDGNESDALFKKFTFF